MQYGYVIVNRTSEEYNTELFISRHLYRNTFYVYRRKVRSILLSRNVVVILSELKYVPPSPIHQNIKDAIVRAKETDTVHILRTLHNSARVYANKPAKEVVRIEKQPGGAKFEDVRPLAAGARGREV